MEVEWAQSSTEDTRAQTSWKFMSSYFNPITEIHKQYGRKHYYLIND